MSPARTVRCGFSICSARGGSQCARRSLCAGSRSRRARSSVQGWIAEAIAAFSGERVTLYGAGRTDAGVHALGQVANFDLARDWGADRVRDALNAQLRPHPIAVVAAEKV